MLHAIIIDDETNGLKSLELLVSKYVPEVKVVATTMNAIEGVDLINNYRPDIVFLDIFMPGLNGFELLQKLEYRKFHLIFTTAHEEYALQAIKESATDYLLKPIDSEDVKKAVARVLKKDKEQKEMPDVLKILKDIEEKQNLKINIPVKSGIEYIPAKEVVYIEARSNSSYVTFLKKEPVLVPKALKEFEIQLCRDQLPFIRIQNSFIINLNHVTRYIREDGGYVVMMDKKSIPISRNKKDEFLKWINIKPDDA
jgi:two-component system, LytTR family, response regulator